MPETSSSAHAALSGRRGVAGWAVATIVATVFLAYHNSFSGVLVFDDLPAIRDNPTIRSLWSTEAFSPPRDTGIGGRPLANVSFALSHALGRGQLWAHHALNLALHLGSALFLFGLVRRTTEKGSASAPGGSLSGDGPSQRRAVSPRHVGFAAALLWAVHPLTTAAVTYLSQRTELLMTFFGLLTLYAFVRGWLVASVLACACGMMSKENMAPVPLIVLLFDRTFVAGTFRAAMRAQPWYYAGLAATWLLLAYLLTTGLHQRSVGFGLGVSPLDYALTECRALVLYLKLAAWPAPLVFDYGRAYDSNASGTTLACALAISVLLIWTLLALRRRTALGFAAAAFFLLLAPSSSFVPVAETPIAENRAYLPLAVLVVSAVLLCARTNFRLGSDAAGGLFTQKFAGTAASLGIAAAFVSLTMARNHEYRSELALWSDTVAKRPQSARAHFNLGVNLLDAGRVAEAAREFEHAVRLNPREAKAHHSLANALLELGRPPEALPHFAEAVALDPGFARAWFNYGLALTQSGKPREAIARLERALQLDPRLAGAENALGNAWFQLDEPARALPHYEAALRRDPVLADAHYNAGSACLDLNRIEDAILHFTAAARLKPDDAEIRNNLGAALLRGGRVDEAIAAFEHALRLRPDYADARDNLGVARSATK